jgi:hypothetical protein
MAASDHPPDRSPTRSFDEPEQPMPPLVFIPVGRSWVPPNSYIHFRLMGLSIQGEERETDGQEVIQGPIEAVDQEGVMRSELISKRSHMSRTFIDWSGCWLKEHAR